METSDRQLFSFPFTSAAGRLPGSLCPTLCSPSHDLPKSGFLADRHKKLTVYCVVFFFNETRSLLTKTCKSPPTPPLHSSLGSPPCLRRAETEQAWNSCHHWGRCWTPTLSTLQGDSSSMSVPWGPKAAWIAVFCVPWLRPSSRPE